MFADLPDVYLQDFGVTATVGSATAKVIFDKPDEIIGEGLAISTEYIITFKTSDLPTLAGGNSISIDSQNYRVREVRKIDDGTFSRALLTKVIA